MSKEFERLVAQAVTLERELRTLEGKRASAKCWIDHCLELGNSDRQKLSDLRTKFEEGIEVYPKIRAVVHDLIGHRGGFGGGGFSWPSGKVENMARVLRVAGSEAAIPELTELGMSRWELFAMAVEVAGEQTPHVFGDGDDMRVFPLPPFSGSPNNCPIRASTILCAPSRRPRENGSTEGTVWA